MKLMAWIPAFFTEFTMGFITIIHDHFKGEYSLETFS